MSGSFIAENTMTFASGFVLLDLTTHLQSVDVGQVEVDHNHVGLESLRGFQHGAAVCDVFPRRRSPVPASGRRLSPLQGGLRLSARGVAWATSTCDTSAGLTGSPVFRCGAG